MATKKMLKAFYFSTEMVKKFIETRIDDIAAKEGRSSSYIIENILLDGLLPANKDAKFIIRTHLYPDDDNGGVKKTLEALFAYNAAGIDWHPKHNNFLPFIEYCLSYGDSSAGCTGKEHQLHHFLSQMASIVAKIESCADSCIEPEDRHRYKLIADEARNAYENAKKDPSSILFREHYELVSDCWDMIGDFDITYRYLSDLASMGKFQENIVARNTLFDIINDISKAW